LGRHGLLRGSLLRRKDLRSEPADQVPQVREAIESYRQCKQSLEAISELNQFLLRLGRERSKQQESPS